MANAPYLSHEGKSSSITLRGENLDEISPYLIVIFFDARDETEFSLRKLFFTRFLTPAGQALLPCYPEKKFGAAGLPETGSRVIKWPGAQEPVMLIRKIVRKDSGRRPSGITPGSFPDLFYFWLCLPDFQVRLAGEWFRDRFSTRICRISSSWSSNQIRWQG